MAKPSKLDRAAGAPRRRLLSTDADAPDRPMRRAGRKHEFARMKRALRKAERRAGDGAEIGGTGATILKFRGAPLARLVDKKRIGTEELQAADDIAIAFHAQVDALTVDPPMIAVGDAIEGGTNLYAGAINWVDPDYDERTGKVLRPITGNREGLQWGTEYVDKVERVPHLRSTVLSCRSCSTMTTNLS